MASSIFRHLSNAGWVLSINLARQLLALGFLMVLVRALDKEAVGQFQFIIAAVGLAGVFTLSGLGQAVIQAVARGHSGTFRRTLKWRLAGSLIGAAVLLCYGWLLQTDDPLRGGFIAAALLFPLAHGLAGWTDFQVGEGRFKLNAIWLGATYLLSYGGMIVALWLGEPGVLWLIVIMKATLAALNIVVVTTILSRVPRDAADEPGALRYGLEMSLWGATNTLGSHIDKVLIFFFLSPAALAIFVIAERIPEIVKKYVESTMSVLLPGFARAPEYTKEMDRSIFKLNILYWLILIIVIISIPNIIMVAFSSEYQEAAHISQLLCATLLLAPTAQFRFAFIRSKLASKAGRNIILFSNVARIICALIFTPLWGAYGAIAAVALSRVLVAFMIERELRKFRAG